LSFLVEERLKRLFPQAIFKRDSLLYWDGGPADVFNKTAFTNTATAVGTNIHRADSITFNGTTSKVDCGSEVVGVGNITLLAWFNAVGYGETNVGRIVDNGKFWARVNSTGSKITVTSDGVTEVSSADDSAPTATEVFVAVTRTSAGVVNIYKNGVLSGSADQASGTTEAGSTNLFIGNNSGASATFDGTLSHVRVFNKILTLEQIGQLYNTEK